MKYYTSFLFIISLLLSCNTENKITKALRTDFSSEETELIKLSKEMIGNCYYGTLITIDKNGQPKSRVMEPFSPDTNLEIWMATNPKSRKVKEIKNNSKSTLHYFDKNNMGYVSFYGNAYIVNDDSIKATKWKKGWERFYKNQKEDYMLIQFIPDSLELISIANNFTGNEKTWRPHKVILR